MDERLKYLQLGALLHDIGKIVRRAGLDYSNHSDAGIIYLKENNLLDESYAEIYEIIRNHHYNDLKNANLDSNSLAYIVYEADNIASGIDRVKYDKGNYGNEMMPLNSIFNRVNMDKKTDDKQFELGDFKENSFNMPKKGVKELQKSDYIKILNLIKENMTAIKDSVIDDFYLEKLMNVFEALCAYFPSSAYVDYPDISYYDHIKLTTAISSCMYVYDVDNNISNFKNEYLLDKEVRNKDKFLFVSGEFSGIQDFIYTIVSKMAMKSLRGRSFYLELFIEHIIDEILLELNLSRVNLIYSGASHFYLILPNTEKTKEVLDKYKEIVNTFLLEQVGTSIYFELVYTATNANELGNGFDSSEKKENKIGDIFKDLTSKSSIGKLRRYSKEQLQMLICEDSEINSLKSNENTDTQECRICKKSEYESVLKENSYKLIKNKLDDDEQEKIEICNACKNYIQLGRDISKMYHSKDKERSFIVEFDYASKEDEENLLFPKYKDNFEKDYVYIKKLEKDNLLKLIKNDKSKIRRYYAINSSHIGEGLSKNIWIGNYNIEKEGKNEKNLIEFKQLVKKTKGVERLAVLRADVDNLGSLFQNGFEDKNSNEPYKYVTLSKSAVLSRYLSDFFKKKINFILEKTAKVDGSNQFFKNYCDVISKERKNNDINNEKRKRDIVIVYSGGDDLFAIGTWNDIIEFAVDLRRAFKDFTNSKITFSAGIGFFDENFPIYQMANITGNLESLAKSYPEDVNEKPTKDVNEKSTENANKKPTKDAVALFGQINNNNINHIYSWDEFIDEILEDKYKFLKSVTRFEQEAGDEEESKKVFVGMSKWYKLMNQLSKILNSDDKRLDIARFAYTLARIENNDKNKENYQKLKEKLFEYMKSKKDSKQLLTVINLIIYEERKKTNEQ